MGDGDLKLIVNITRIKGFVWVVLSALFFYLATLVVKISGEYCSIPSTIFTFYRFLIGALVVSCSVFYLKRDIRPREYLHLTSRVIFNLISVYLLYCSVEYGSVALANVLNLTYPLHIALFEFVLLKGRRDYGGYLASMFSVIGILLMLDLSGSGVSTGYIYGVTSAVTSAIAIISLNITLRKNHPDTVLFFVFGVGAICAYPLVAKNLHTPSSLELSFLLTSSILGILGQYALTIGAQFITAIETGVTGLSRILFALLFGLFLHFDKPLSLYGWIGAFLILMANCYLMTRRSLVKHANES